MRCNPFFAFLPPTPFKGLVSGNRSFVMDIVTGFSITLCVFMSMVLLIACAMGSGHAYQSTGTVDSGKPIGEYRRDVKAFVQKSKRTEDRSARFGAIVDLCLLHDQIVNDPRLQTNGQLQGFRAIAADRLKKCRKQIELEMVRAERAAKKQYESAHLGSKRDQARDSSPADRLSSGSSTESELDFETCNRWLIEDMYSMTQISGGPIQVWNHVGGNYSGPLCDYGPDLVRLIETTIDPDSWRSNGGAGVIYYYQPLRILVVSASSRVHDDLTDLLQTLRTNGR